MTGPRLPSSDFFARLLGSIRPSSTEHRLDEEIRFHVDMQAAKNERLGMSPEEARRQAMVSFGGAGSMQGGRARRIPSSPD